MNSKRGFSIVELVIVIAIIGVLASITVFAFGSWRTRAAETEARNDILAAVSKIKDNMNWDSTYPTNQSDFEHLYTPSGKVTMTYTLRSGGASYCLRAQSTVVTTVNYYYDSLVGGNPTKTAC